MDLSMNKGLIQRSHFVSVDKDKSLLDVTPASKKQDSQMPPFLATAQPHRQRYKASRGGVNGVLSVRFEKEEV